MKTSVVMQSDFGLDSGLVACMHGMCKLVDGELCTYDITHLLPAFDIEAASYCLQYTVPYWPIGTVFVSVVAPGVGTSRRAYIPWERFICFLWCKIGFRQDYVCRGGNRISDRGDCTAQNSNSRGKRILCESSDPKL